MHTHTGPAAARTDATLGAAHTHTQTHTHTGHAVAQTYVTSGATYTHTLTHGACHAWSASMLCNESCHI